jgi:hypothetical protein
VLKTALGRIDDDPRLTVVLISWLRDTKWPGSGAMAGWEVVFERLVALRDPRAIEPLRRMTKDVPQFLGAAHTKAMVEKMAATADALETACRNLPKQAIEDAAFAKLEALLEEPPADLFRAKQQSATGRSNLDLIARVWERPRDDGLKGVIADALLEAGDPWGELITLQLNARGKAGKRIDTLLHKHANVFCGPIAKVVKRDYREFEKGFLTAVTTNADMVGRRYWQEAASCPHWATVRHVTLDMGSTPLWWIPEWAKNPALKSLERVVIRRWSTEYMVLERKPGGGFTVTKIAPRALDLFRAFQGFVSSLPPAELAKVTIADVKRAELLRKPLALIQRGGSPYFHPGR